MARNPDTTSRDAIATLKSQGWSESRIAKAVGRDSSLISQIAKGKKPGSNLASALGSLASGGTAKAPERRTTKSGDVARVRVPDAEPTRIKGVSDFERRLERAAQSGGKVQIITAWDDASLTTRTGPGSDYDVSREAILARTPSGGFFTTMFGRDRGNTKGVSASKLLSDFRQFKKRHPELKGKALTQSYATSRANKTLKPGGGVTIKQKVSGFQEIRVRVLHDKPKAKR